MSKFTRRLVLALGLGLVALPGLAQDQPQPFADPSRLVSIGGSLTEVVYALGKQDLLVARDSTATYPEAALALPDVGYMRMLSPEGVLSVNPSALLVIEGSGPVDTLDALAAASVPYVTIPDGFTADAVVDKVKRVGAALAADTEATALANDIQAQFDRTAAVVGKITAPKKVLFILSAADGRFNVAGVGTAADGIIALAGAQNAIMDFPGYKPLSDDALIAANPDVVLMMEGGGGHLVSDDALLAHAGISLTNAGKTGSIIRMDGSYLLGFGPRTPAAALELARNIYGDALN